MILAESAGGGFDLGWLLYGAGIIAGGILVAWYGTRRSRAAWGDMRPGGRRDTRRGAAADTRWLTEVARLERKDPTPIAQATQGPVRVVGTVVRASGSLGGPPERACVYRNRPGAAPELAVAAEVLVVADDSGRCGVENLEGARVSAPTERHSLHHESVSVCVGDRVEVLGTFSPDRTDGDDPAATVYGTIGTDGPLELRVVERPQPPETPAATPTETP